MISQKFDDKRIRTIVILMLFAFLIYKFEFVLDLLGKGLSILFPFFMGAFIALIINQPMRFLEKHLTFLNKNIVLKKIKRPVCLTLATLFVVAIVAFIVAVVLPEFISTVKQVFNTVPELLKQFDTFLKESESPIADYINISIPNASDVQTQLTNASNFLLGGFNFSASSIVASVTQSMLNFFVAFVFSIYLLADKERVKRQFSKLTRAYLSENAAGKVMKVAKIVNTTFSRFITGQCLEALTSGTFVFLALTVFGIPAPYPLLIALLVFIGAFIPIFGPYVAAAIGLIMIISQVPEKIVLFILVYFCTQQLEGSLIYPRIMGNAIGMPSIWVLSAVTIGGGLMGIVGMLIFIPICSVVYQLLGENVNKRLLVPKNK